MTIYDKIIQGTDEWKEIRHSKVGGSTAKEVMTNLGKSVRTCAIFSKLLSERMEDFDPFQSSYQNAAMQRGNEYEPFAREEYERIYDETVQQVGWVELDGGFIGISPDGWIQQKKKSIEIKCPSAETHVKYMLNFNDFLEDYCWQIVHNFLVLKVDTVDCISFRPENKFNKLIVFSVTKDTEIKISAKATKKVSELVEMLNARLIELESELNKEIEFQNNQIIKF